MNNQKLKKKNIFSKHPDQFGHCNCPKGRLFTTSDKWDEFWDSFFKNAPVIQVSNVLKNPEIVSSKTCYCNLFDIDGIKGDFNISKKISEPIYGSAQVCFKGEVNANINIDLELNSAAQIGIKFVGLLDSGDNLKIQLKVHENYAKSSFTWVSKFVVSQDCSLNLSTTGIIGSSSTASISSFDNKVLSLGGDSDSRMPVVNCVPAMDISEREVFAKHGFSFSGIPVDSRIYMQSRGLDEEMIKKLYKEAFLKS
ncbi:SufD family Fe-S cluster assembly protein [Candidatus Dojkabacteria bacterium]|nr:SufD family Fe-S cluster assembly protein [Candidatus Dojkabacteria bacterium]